MINPLSRGYKARRRLRLLLAVDRLGDQQSALAAALDQIPEPADLAAGMPRAKRPYQPDGLTH